MSPMFNYTAGTHLDLDQLSFLLTNRILPPEQVQTFLDG
jgi:hypothetical protein